MKTHNEIKLLPLVFAVGMATVGMAHAQTIVTFNNNTDAVVHLDYTDCKSDPKPDPDGNLPYHSTITFTCTAPKPVIQLVQYSGPYQKVAKCYFPDNGDYCTTSGNTMTLHWPVVPVDYAKIQQNVQAAVNGFDAERKDGLTIIPNVIPMNKAQLDKAEPWSLQFSYDASRYPLFNGANCLANPASTACTNSKAILTGLLATVKAIPEVTSNFTLPTGGIWAYNVGTAKAGQAVDKSAYPSGSGGTPALDGPMALAEHAVYGKSTFYTGLINTLKKYDLAKHTPADGGKEADFLSSTSPYFNGSLALLSQALLIGNGDLEKTRTMPNSGTDFDTKGGFIATNYKAWTSSGFLAPFEVTDQKNVKVPGLRVIFTVKNAPHSAKDNWTSAGDSPTVSEGMAYGLLIAYAANDQERFNQLLNYVLFEAYNHGCAGMNATQSACSIKTQYLMPWLVDQTGKPFHYTVGGGFLTNGSATDADINIAWALKMAAKATDWKPYTYAGMNYATLAKKMQDEIARYDINKDVQFFGTTLGELYGPGSQWGTNGKNVVYSGYDAPQAFEALSH